MLRMRILEVRIVLAALLLLFGARCLPQLRHGLRAAIRGFKRAMADQTESYTAPEQAP